MLTRKSILQAKFFFFITNRLYYINAFIFFVYPLKILVLGSDGFSEIITIIVVIAFLCSTLVTLWRHLTRMPLAWSWIGWACILIVFLRLIELYLSSLGKAKIIVSGDNLWLLSIIRDFMDFGNTRNSHAISGIGYEYHYGAIIQISVLARLHDFFFGFGLIFLMPMALYLFSSLIILKITSLISSSSKSQILALIFFTFVPSTIFSGSLGELFDTVISEPTFRYSYYLPTYYGFSLVLFLALIALRVNPSLILFLSPLLLCSLYSTKPVFLIVAMPLVLLLTVGRLHKTSWKVHRKLSFLAALISQMIVLILLLPRTGLSSPVFDIHIDLRALLENAITAPNQTILTFFIALCFSIWHMRNRLDYLQLHLSVSVILTSFITFVSTKVIILTYSEELPSRVITKIESSGDYSSLLTNHAQALYLIVTLYSLLIPYLTRDKEKEFLFRVTSTLVCICILVAQIGQVSNELKVFVREKRFISEDYFDYGPYISSVQKVSVSNSLILPNDTTSPIKEYSRPNSADYLSAFTNHSFYISRLGWQSFNYESWERTEEARKFFTTSDLGFVLDFIQKSGISHVAIHARCSNFVSNSLGAEGWEFLTPEQLLLRIDLKGLPINFENPEYGSSRCI